MTVNKALMAALDHVDAFDQDAAEPMFDDAALQAIAGSHEQVRTLIQLACDPRAQLARRFAAAEAITQSGHTATLAADKQAAQSVGAMLAEAIAHDRYHNRWGLPGHFVGRTGELLLGLGSTAASALRPLLDNERPLQILGSETATINLLHRYRIRDLAGYLISQHQGVAWHDDPVPAVRDRLNRSLDR